MKHPLGEHLSMKKSLPYNNNKEVAYHGKLNKKTWLYHTPLVIENKKWKRKLAVNQLFEYGEFERKLA